MVYGTARVPVPICQCERERERERLGDSLSRLAGGGAGNRGRSLMRNSNRRQLRRGRSFRLLSFYLLPSFPHQAVRRHAVFSLSGKACVYSSR